MTKTLCVYYLVYAVSQDTYLVYACSACSSRAYFIEFLVYTERDKIQA